MRAGRVASLGGSVVTFKRTAMVGLLVVLVAGAVGCGTSGESDAGSATGEVGLAEAILGESDRPGGAEIGRSEAPEPAPASQLAPAPAAVPLETFNAVSAGGAGDENHSCGLRADGTVTCWGENGKGQASAPDSWLFSAVSAGGAHSCGLRTDSTVTCWGWNVYSQAVAPDGAVQRRQRRLCAFVRAAHRRDYRMLGQQRLWESRCAGRVVQRGQRRQPAFVRAAHRQHHHLLGQPLRRAGRRAGWVL